MGRLWQPKWEIKDRVVEKLDNLMWRGEKESKKSFLDPIEVGIRKSVYQIFLHFFFSQNEGVRSSYSERNAGTRIRMSLYHLEGYYASSS